MPPLIGGIAPDFLDKELQDIVRSTGSGIGPSAHGKGRGTVDKLVRVRLRSGVDAFLLVHVEVQGRLDGPAARRVVALRIFQYRYAIWARHLRRTDTQSQIYSLCIVLDGVGAGPRLTYESAYLGQGLRFCCPVVELAQWRQRLDELDALAAQNPFAVIVMAQLQANHHSRARRLGPLLDLARKLHGYGYGERRIRQVMRLLEWILSLPAELEDEYLQAVTALEQESRMTYVTIAERHGIKKGMEQGHTEGQANMLLGMVQHRFGLVSDSVRAKISNATRTQLETWSLNILDAASLEDVFRS